MMQQLRKQLALLLYVFMASETAASQSRTLLFIIMILVTTSEQYPLRSMNTGVYELIYATDKTTEVTGSITMCCRSSTTAENMPLNEVEFWLNLTSCTHPVPSLRERTDVNVIVIDNYSIKFNLTRSLEGYYTCGKLVQVDENCVLSSPTALICKHQIATIRVAMHNV